MLRVHHLDLEGCGSDTVAIAIAEIDSVTEDDRNRMSGILDSAELERAGRFVRDSDRNRYLVSHYFLRTLLSDHVGIAPEKLKFGMNRFKKPHLEDSELQFNLTHSGAFAAVAISRNKRVGIDIETGVNEQTVEDIAQRILTSFEMNQLGTVEGERKVDMFARFWIIKESILKAFGEGLYQNPREIELSVEDTPRLLRLPVAMGPANAWRSRLIESPVGFPEIACTIEK